jgi:tRNA modification GTPase
VIRAEAAALTAPGRGAIAVVALWGPDALLVADRVFVPNAGRSLGETPSSRPRVGRIGGPSGEEVVAVITRRGSSDPPTSRVEIHCHGGDVAVRSLLDRLSEHGATVRDAPAAARSLATSRLVAEAWTALAEASTEPTAAILLDQAQGALGAAIARIAGALADHPTAALWGLDELIERGRCGVRLRRGWTIALVGRPNVGKSRLLNALAGHERTIVTAVPGTTRDVVSVRTALGGWPVELLDTAGRRDASEPLEAEGIARGRARQRAADIVVVVLDGSEPLTAGDRTVLAESPDAVRVANKCDLPSSWDAARAGALPVSAARGDGVEALIGSLARRIVPRPPAVGAGVPFEERHLARLRRGRALLAAGRFGSCRRALLALLE